MLENLEILNPSKELTMWSVGFETSSEKEKQLVRWQLYKLKILSGLLSFWILYVQYADWGGQLPRGQLLRGQLPQETTAHLSNFKSDLNGIKSKVGLLS